MFAVTPIDGRYQDKTKFLSEYFSEAAYITRRLEVELKYLKELSNILGRNIEIPEYKINLEEIKEIEKVTKHDVKAIEYYIRKNIVDSNLVHFGLTSNDINSVAFTLNFRDGLSKVSEYYEILRNNVKGLIEKSVGIPMLGRTHGQPAVPTTLEKELLVYYERLKSFEKRKLSTKFGGAIGNFNALYFVRQDIDWIKFADNFIESLNLKRQRYTTQIEHYDEIAEVLNEIKQKRVIIKSLIDNIWLYISLGYFSQITINSEVGSSTMPQKVNPIHFENALGNFELLVGMIEAITRSLPISRYQRDIKDSTILRNIGVVFSYFYLMLDSTIEGLNRIRPNKDVIINDLNSHPEVIMEGIQTYLRYIDYLNAYEICKDFSRGEEVTIEKIHNFIDTKLKISDLDKEKLKSLTPLNYVGIY